MNPSRFALVFRDTILKWSKPLLSGLLLVAFVFNGAAQSRQSLEKKRKFLLSEINQTTQLLSTATKNRTATLNRYVALKKLVEDRETLISTIQEELTLTSEQVERTSDIINSLESDLERLREEYATMLRHAYRQKINKSGWYLLFSANSFNEAFRRWQYLKRYHQYRKKQARLIVETQESLTRKIALLEERKLEKENLLAEQEGQKALLKSEMEDKSRLLESLQADEKRLQRELDSQRAAHEKLNQAIESVIQTEMAASRKRARSRESLRNRKRAKSGASRTPPATPEAQALSANFRANRGKLPWPVKRGIVTRYFGKQPHPTLKRVQITNNGIDIQTGTDAEVRAVFGGEVVGRQFVPGYNYMVIIRHGDYYTVYSNLADVTVNKNDQVKTYQRIGTASVNKKEQVAELHFEVWQDKQRLNPLKWITKR